MRIARFAAAAVLAAWVSAFAATLSDVDTAITKYLAEGRADSASALVDEALDLASAEFAGDSLAFAAYADSLANRFFQAYEFSRGVELFERGVSLREAVLAENDLALAGPIENLSTAYYIAGRYNEAAAAQERVVAIKAAKLGPNNPSTAQSRLELAIVYYPMARYADAERELRMAVAALEPARATDPLPLAEAEQVMGEVCRELNRYDEAEEYLTDALALARGGLPERDPLILKYLNSLAGCYKDQARYDEAELLLEEALDMVEADESLEDERAALTLNLAEIERLQGRYDDAIPLYERAIALATKSLPPLDLAVFRNQIASAYAEMGRPKDAELQYRQALAVADSASDVSPLVIAQIKNDLGVLLARQGRVDDGEKYLKEAITLREGVYGPNHPLVAVSLTQLARAQASLFDEARVKPTPRDRDAALLLDRALAILDSTEAEPEGRVDAGVARAQLYYREHRVDRAASTMAGALDAVEALRPHRGGGGAERIEFIRRYVDAYDQMTAWQIELNEPASALAYSERRRARVLVDRLTGTTAITSEPISPEALERLRAEKRDLEKQLGTCEEKSRALHAQPRLSKSQREELARVETNCDRLVADIQRTSERILRMENTGSATPLTNVSTRHLTDFRVTQGEALLVYHIGTESSFLFVIEGGARGVRSFTLTVTESSGKLLGMPIGPLTRSSLSQLLTGYDAAGKTTGLGLLRQLSRPVESAGAVAARAQQAIHERLHALFAVLMPSDVWKTVRVAREACIIPDGPLSAFPMEALVTANAGGDPVYWLDDGPVIRYAPSIAVLDALRRVAEAGAANEAAVLSVCNPNYGAGSAPAADAEARGTRGGSLAALPGTARETQTVVAAFGKDRVTVLCGEDATEAAVRREVGNKEIIHLATHGLVSQDRSDLRSALAFTPGMSPRRDLQNDGFLYLFEIYDLSVSAELVVLSACESSAGNYVMGEGVMALSRGFLSAGAKRVVATQWKVDDAATATLVGDFLSRVAASERAHKGVDYALALRDAKRELRKSALWSQPFHWAAFVISGAP